MLGRLGRRMVAVGLAGSFLLAAPAVAQEDPYGSTTTTTSTTVPAGQQPSCLLRTESAGPTQPVTVTVRNVPRATTVRLLLDGAQVAQKDANGPGQSARVHVDMTFEVPAGTPPGMHEVTAVGASFAVRCLTNKGKSLEVLGEEVLSNEQSRGGGFGALPRTGMYVLLFLLVAAALILLGRALLEPNRRGAQPSRPGRSRR